MDPQVTLWNLLESIQRNDRESIDENLESLAAWNRKGGFMPEVDRRNGTMLVRLDSGPKENPA